MDKQARLGTIRATIKEHEENLSKLNDRLTTLIGYAKPDYYTLKARASEGIALEGLIEDLKIEAKSLQEEIDLDSRTEAL